MNTQNHITERDVFAFLAEKRRLIKAASATLHVYCSDATPEGRWMVTNGPAIFAGETADEAIEGANATYKTPTQEAAEKRSKAAELLAEAAALEDKA